MHCCINQIFVHLFMNPPIAGTWIDKNNNIFSNGIFPVFLGPREFSSMHRARATLGIVCSLITTTYKI